MVFAAGNGLLMKGTRTREEGEIKCEKLTASQTQEEKKKKEALAFHLTNPVFLPELYN